MRRTICVRQALISSDGCLLMLLFFSADLWGKRLLAGPCCWRYIRPELLMFILSLLLHLHPEEHLHLHLHLHPSTQVRLHHSYYL